MIAAPAELGELVVGRTAEHDRVAVLEVLGEPGETDDLGRADKSEILGVEVDDLPFARKGLFVDWRKGRLAVFLVTVEAGLDTGDVERFQFLTYGFHGCSYRGGLFRQLPRLPCKWGRFISYGSPNDNSICLF